jgi:hypothetical protein
MTRYKRFVFPAVLIGGAAIASVFASRMAERVHSRRKEMQKAAETGWEDEGGSVAAGDVPPP